MTSPTTSQRLSVSPRSEIGMDREERRRKLFREAMAQCQQPPAGSAPALTTEWLAQMRSTGRDMPITDDHNLKNSLAHSVRCHAPRGSIVPPSVSVGGLTENLIAGSLTARGWDPTWSFEGVWSEDFGQDCWALLYLVRPVATGHTGDRLQQASCEVEGQILGCGEFGGRQWVLRARHWLSESEWGVWFWLKRYSIRTLIFFFF